MTLLGLGTADSVQDYYMPNGEVNKDKLRSHLQDFRNKFQNDPQLCNDVERLVHPGDDARGMGGAFKQNTTTVNSTPNNFKQSNNFVQSTFNPAPQTLVNSAPKQVNQQESIPLQNAPTDDDYNPYMK